MEASALKEKWRAGHPSPGLWLRLTDPTVCDLLTDFAIDWVVFDAEHAALDLQTLQTLVIALKGSPIVPLVRVPALDRTFIKRVLDLGTTNGMMPLTELGLLVSSTRVTSL